MKITIYKKNNNKLKDKQINITIEYSSNTNIENFINYIKEYDTQKILVRKNNEYFQINLNDIIIFYSDKKNNYCKIKNEKYKINYSLNKLENQKNDFIRISKSCIINIKHLDSFDIGKAGTIIAKLDDGTEEIVSRRRVKEILKYIKERSL